MTELLASVTILALLVPGIHGWRKEHLVSAVCTCVKLTSFIAPLFCIMTQPYLMFLINTSSRSIAEQKLKQSLHGHFSMASSYCILRLCRLCVRPRLMHENSSLLSLQVAITHKNTKIIRLCKIHTRKNTKITRFPRFLGKFRACTNS